MLVTVVRPCSCGRDPRERRWKPTPDRPHRRVLTALVMCSHLDAPGRVCKRRTVGTAGAGYFCLLDPRAADPPEPQRRAARHVDDVLAITFSVPRLLQLRVILKGDLSESRPSRARDALFFRVIIVMLFDSPRTGRRRASSPCCWCRRDHRFTFVAPIAGLLRRSGLGSSCSRSCCSPTRASAPSSRSSESRCSSHCAGHRRGLE